MLYHESIIIVKLIELLGILIYLLMCYHEAVTMVKTALNSSLYLYILYYLESLVILKFPYLSCIEKRNKCHIIMHYLNTQSIEINIQKRIIHWQRKPKLLLHIDVYKSILTYIDNEQCIVLIGFFDFTKLHPGYSLSIQSLSCNEDITCSWYSNALRYPY